mmetsp:Transcript_8724/g.11352  ORF Transcript_8724/g.11352 Transcript_8724/m.11352 type:complete len:268 (-) Transcript_8724:1883-2686(-)
MGGKFYSKVDKDGNRVFVKRDQDMPIRVVEGTAVDTWFRTQEPDKWAKFGEHDLSTAELVAQYIKPLITEEQPRLHDIWMKEQQKKRMKNPIAFLSHRIADTKHQYRNFDHDYCFISHTWAQPAKYTTGFIANVAETGGLKVWIDVCSIAQHPGDEQSSDLVHLTEAIYGASEFKMLLDKEGVYFTRIWCLFEIATRILSKRGVMSAIVPELLGEYGVASLKDMKQSDKREYWARSADLLQHVLDNGIDAAKAQATVDSDRVRILSW